MKRYMCPKTGCEGVVAFTYLMPNSDPGDKALVKMMILGERPGKCDTCGGSFLKNECREVNDEGNGPTDQ